MNYSKRWKIKFFALRKFGLFKRIRLIAKYIIEDIANIILLSLTKTADQVNLKEYKTILFIEPRKQGYGDLLFQTPIFKLIGSKCDLDVLCQAKHKCIIVKNPYIKNIFSHNDKIDFEKYDCVFYLARSTVSENLLARKCKKAIKIPLDKKHILWTDIFKKYHHILAWQEVFNVILKNSFVYDQPRIYLNEYSKDKNSIVFVAGIENSEKQIKNIDKIVIFILKLLENTRYKLTLVGKTSEETNYEETKAMNLVNKMSYQECLNKISSARLVIGPEGSLVHMSVALGIPTIIGSYGRLPEIYKTDNKKFF